MALYKFCIIIIIISYSPVTGNRVRRSDWRGGFFDWKLLYMPKTRLLCFKLPKF